MSGMRGSFLTRGALSRSRGEWLRSIAVGVEIGEIGGNQRCVAGVDCGGNLLEMVQGVVQDEKRIGPEIACPAHGSGRPWRQV